MSTYVFKCFSCLLMCSYGSPTGAADAAVALHDGIRTKTCLYLCNNIVRWPSFHARIFLQSVFCILRK